MAKRLEKRSEGGNDMEHYRSIYNSGELNNWTIDAHKQLRKYEDEDDSLMYPDSRYYRKNKQKFALSNDDRPYIPNGRKIY